MAEGGEVGETAANQKEPEKVSAEGEDQDGEIKDAVGKEMMESIHSKDHKRLMGAIEAAILHHMSKKED
jgi:hypothetical protein